LLSSFEKQSYLEAQTVFSNSFTIKANLVCRNIIRSVNHKFITLAVTLGLLVVILHSYCFGLKLLSKIWNCFEGLQLLTKYCWGDKNKNEMGRACSAYGGEERHMQGFGGEI
jgi:hypothetical protein